ncbi:unnamed protein product [Spirodela intermedia]|uniref:Uncharacterized protein n=1 Tax=Spirodela intermedia TaxID=51605 RepID=A0A7I8KKJ2_SPIIN|nr:unnamed protein product [Spirodela intermedia]
MEAFFALLESIREMRKRSPVGSGEPRKKAKVGGSVWTPTFQWEDFASAADSGNWKGSNPSVGIGQGKEEKEDEGPWGWGGRARTFLRVLTISPLTIIITITFVIAGTRLNHVTS